MTNAIATRPSAVASFRASIQKSWDSNSRVMTVTVHPDDVRATRSAIRRAATHLNLGVHIRNVAVTPTRTVVTYVARERRTFAKSINWVLID